MTAIAILGITFRAQAARLARCTAMKRHRTDILWVRMALGMGDNAMARQLGIEIPEEQS